MNEAYVVEVELHENWKPQGQFKRRQVFYFPSPKKHHPVITHSDMDGSLSGWSSIFHNEELRGTIGTFP